MSFSHLTSVIGPAPSEMDNHTLLTKLAEQRDRVRRTLVWFREQDQIKSVKKPRAKPKTKARSVSLRTFQSAAEAAGLSPDDIRLALKMKKQLEKGA